MQTRTSSTRIFSVLFTTIAIGATSIAQVPGFSRHGLQPGAQIGHAISPAGDMDGDGAPDYVLGVPRYDGTNGQDAGLALVLSGLDGREIRRFEGAFVSEKLGFSVAGGGDLDGDGIPDLMVGAPDNGVSGPQTGRVVVFSGATGALLQERFGSTQFGFYGWSVAVVGDVNGDGFDEYVVGVPYEDGNGSDSGRAFLLRGPTLNTLAILDGDQARDRFGWAVCGLDDVDGDGAPDFAIGAPGPPGAAGYVRVFSGATGAFIRTHTGQPGEALGTAIASAGDWNLDGRGDLALGAPLADGPFVDSGRVAVRSGADASLLFERRGEFSAGQFGSALAGGEDTNGDGRVDLLVGVPKATISGQPGVGVARLFSSTNGAPMWIVTGRAAGDGLGSALAFIGDVNGSGSAELVIGSPAADFRVNSGGVARTFGDTATSPKRYCATNANSTGNSASVGWIGTCSSSSNDLELFCSGLPPGAPTVLFYGAGSTSTPLGQGFLCIDPNPQGFLHRLPSLMADGAGVVIQELDARHPATAAGAIRPGTTWFFQAWYRDSAFGGFNLSDALEITFVP